ncbi:MAG: MazG-like family protein [Anaerolineales bacterium]|nr:MazG-like family protein [Anaerolineales bacterium]
MPELPAEADLTLRNLQAFHISLDQDKSFDTDVIRNVAYLTAELGEVMGAIRELKRGESAPETARAHIGEELADCLAYVLKLENYLDVDLQDAYIQKMQTNLARIWYPRGEESS